MIQLGRKALVVGISGASSSGKTTLSRLLRDIFPNTFILHEDDFFRGDGKFHGTTFYIKLTVPSLPLKNGLKDGDCAEALVIPDMVASLDHIKNHGTFPSDFKSTEDQNEVGECFVPDATILDLKAKVKTWTEPGNIGHGVLGSGPSAINLCIFDGFLLYSSSMSAIHRYMDIKLFIQVTYAKSKARREARSAYVTREGVWQDPPGYFDKIVWANYVEDHQWMFEYGDVDGKLEEKILRESRIEAQTDKGPDVDMEISLEWAVETLMKGLANLVTE